MDLSKLRKKGPNYYDVDGLLMTSNSIRTLLLCAELELKGVAYSSLDFRIIELCRRGLLATVMKRYVLLTYITKRGYVKLAFLRSLNIERD